MWLLVHAVLVPGWTDSPGSTQDASPELWLENWKGALVINWYVVDGELR